MKHLALLALAFCALACNKTDNPRTSAGDARKASATKQPEGTATAISHTFRPAEREFSESHLTQLKLPNGFRASVFAKGLQNIRMFAVGPDGVLYATRRQQGDVIALPDANNDGVADETRSILTLKDAHGICFRSKAMYIAAVKQIHAIDGQGAVPKVIITDLPDGGQHPNRTIAFGPDGKLYITVGSTCNQCEESNPEAATMLICDPDGTNRRIFASGLRNTIGFGWHPATKELWGFDHGSDGKGNDLPPEELNKIIDAGEYGWPYVYGAKQLDPTYTQDQKLKERGLSREQFAARTTAPTLMHQAHSAPLQMAFNASDKLGANYKDGAFAAMHGSWNRSPAVGYNVAFVKFENGQPTRIEDFLSGFLIEDGKAFFGRPCGVAIAPDGALLVGDDVNGVIYRITRN